MLESYKWMGWVWVWDGMGWKSLKGVILRAPLCGANKEVKKQKETLRCAVMRFGRSCKHRVFLWNHKVERNLKDGEYKSLKYKKYGVLTYT